MGFLSVLLLVIFVIASLLLVGVVLIQDEQGEGLGGLFGGGGSASFGSRSGNVLTRFTSVLGAVFLVCAFVLAWINRTPESGDLLGAARRGAAEERSIEEWWVIEENAPAPVEATAEEAETAAPASPESTSDE